MFSGSIVALVTPFTENLEIDIAALTKLIEWHVSVGTSAIVLAGTTGESPTLSHNEKLLLATTAVKVSQGRIKIIVGNGSNNTAESIQLTHLLNKTGIDGFLTVTPYYNKPTNEGLIAHFTEIAKASELPIILYNVPSRTQCDMKNEVVIALSELSNVVGLKDATADLARVKALTNKCCQPFTLLSGDDASALAFCQAGGHGVISVTANIAADEMAQIYRLLEQDKFEQANGIDIKLNELHQKLFIESSPMAVKWGMYKLGLLPNANVRLPLVKLSSSGQSCIEQVIINAELKSWEH